MPNKLFNIWLQGKMCWNEVTKKHENKNERIDFVLIDADQICFVIWWQIAFEYLLSQMQY